MNPSIRRRPVVRATLALALAAVWAASAPAAEPHALATPQPDTHVVAKPGMASQVLRQLPLRIEGESLVGSVAASAGPVSAQDMSGFGADWSGGAQLFWQPPDPVDTPIRNWPHLTFLVDVSQDGTYALAIRHTRAPDYGDVRVFVRGAPVVDLSGYAASVQAARVEAGKVKLKAGKNQVVLTVFRRPAASTASFVGLDALELTRQP
jgi:hypothetical protein